MRKTNQNEPINNFLDQNIKKHPISFHMPGHKYGKFDRCIENHKKSSYDITEIPGADNIKKPKGIIRESIKRVSEIYGSLYAFYLTNGTTSGIHAILHYTSLVGKKILLSRDCHISAVNGALLFGVDVVFIQTEVKNGMPVPVTPEAVTKSLNENPDVCGVLLTSPNYYGKVADLYKIAEIVHRKDKFLAVDEAHGAHFQFAGLSDKSGINSNADFVCHSLHKTLPVSNQGAILHVCSNRINPTVIISSINMLLTTSPSYPLLASMERAVNYFQKNKSREYSKLAKMIELFKNMVSKNAEIMETDDFTRIVIRKSINGFKLAKILHEKYKIDVEAADFESIVCISTPFNTKRDFRKLAEALNEINAWDDLEIENIIRDVPKVAKKMANAYLQKHENVTFDMAVGRICGTIIVSYPPGTPLLCPGEIVDGYTVKYIKKVINAGGTVLGVENNKIPVLE